MSVRTHGPIGFIPPLLPTTSPTIPTGPGWVHEIKHDGFRTQVVIQEGRARAYTRRGHDWTGRYPTIIRAAEKLRCRSAVIDGEVIIQDKLGRSDFGGLMAALDAQPHRLVFFAFDLLRLDRDDLSDLPLLERRARLRNLIRPSTTSPVQFSDPWEGDPATLFAYAEQLGLEGIVSKRVKSRYRSGRSRDWLKVKCWVETDLVIIGTELDKRGVVALLAREEEGGELAFEGRASVALPVDQKEALWARLERLATVRPMLGGVAGKGVRWVRPKVRVGVRYLRGEESLRHATVRRILTP